MPKPECPPLFLSGDQKGELCQFFYKPKNVCPRFSHHSDRPMNCIPCYPIEMKPICCDPFPKRLPTPQAHGHSTNKPADGPKPVKFESMCCPKPCLPCVPPKYLVPCLPCPEPSANPCPVQPVIACPVQASPTKGQCPMVCFMPQKKKKVPEYVYQATVTTPKKVANRYISSDGDSYYFFHSEKKTPKQEQCQYYLVKAQDVGKARDCKAGEPSLEGSGSSLPASVPCLPCERPRVLRPPCPARPEPVLPCCATCISSTPHEPTPTFCYVPCPPVFCQKINPF